MALCCTLLTFMGAFYLLGDVNVGRGRFIATTPWEAIWNGIAEWWGLDEDSRADVLPHASNFDDRTIFSVEDLFRA